MPSRRSRIRRAEDRDPGGGSEGGRGLCKRGCENGAEYAGDDGIKRRDPPDGTIRITEETLEQCTSRRSLLYDKKGEEHYNLISALHKSMRNTDPDAAVYWLARMLEAGEDPLYVARRLIRFASEDVGIADSSALTVAVSAYQACHFIECGMQRESDSRRGLSFHGSQIQRPLSGL